MLSLALSLAMAACSPHWSPDASREGPAQVVSLWSEPATCKTLIVNGPHRTKEGLRGTVLTLDPQGRVADRVTLPKTMWPSAAAVDPGRARLILAVAASSAAATDLRIEARSLSAPFALERGFGAAGVVALSAPRLRDTGASTGSEVVLVVDGAGRLHVVASADSVGEQTALSVWRLLPDGRADPAWHAGGPLVARYPFANSGELTATLTPGGQLVVGVGSRPPQLFRFTTAGELDPSFGEAGVVKLRTGSPRALATGPDGSLRLVARASELQLVSLSADGVAGPPLQWAVHPEHNELPFAVLPLADGRVLVSSRSYDVRAKRGTLLLALWRADGRLDARFGQNGLLEVDEAGVDLQPVKAVLDDAGNVLVAGRRAVPDEPFDGTLFVFRFTLPGAAPADEASSPSSAPPGPSPSLRGSRGAAPPPAPAPPDAGDVGVYVYTDEHGVETWVNSLERVPLKLRTRARKQRP